MNTDITIVCGFFGLFETEAIAAFERKEKPKNKAPRMIPIVSEP